MAYFLRKFPGYKLADLMEEYAISVNAMISASIQLDASETIERANISLLPNTDEEHIEKFFENYKKQLGLPSRSGDDYEKLMTILGG